MKGLFRALLVASFVMNAMGSYALAAEPTKTEITSSKLIGATTADTLTFSATVAKVNGGAPVTAGAVVFRFDGSPQPPVALSASGTATITVTGRALGPGDHNIAADYQGAPDPGGFSPSTASLMQRVKSPIEIGPAVFPDGYVGQEYRLQLTATGGVAPYTFAHVSGGFPAGLSLSPAGLISGTPTNAFNNNFGLVATDSTGLPSNTQLKNLKILNPLPSVSIGEITVREGNAGTTSYGIDLVLSSPATQEITVSHRTRDDSARAGSDYVAASGTITFLVGDLRRLIPFTVTGDTVTEAKERFYVDLTGATGATIATPTGEVFIEDDDAATHVLTVTTAGTGVGTVTSSPAGISCGSTCSTSYSSGTVITLTAAPSATSTFASWSGACAGSGACTISMDAAKSVTATFLKQTYTLAVSRTGSGSGTVISSPAGIDCGATCAATYDAGDIVTLTATADASSTFIGWSGPCSGTGACTVTMDAAKNVSASFATLATASISDKVWNDDDGNGIQDSFPSDAGVAGVTVELRDSTGTTVLASTTTDASGSYVFGGLVAGTYRVRVVPPSGWTFSPQYAGGNPVTNSDADPSTGLTGAIVLAAGASDDTRDVGLIPPTPDVSIADASTTEGNGGFFDVYVMTFTVSLSAPSSRTVTVDFTTRDGTATTADNDYTASRGTVTFPPGTTTRTIVVDTLEDTRYEADETFSVTLSRAVNANIVRWTATGTIVNDDSQPTVFLDKAGPAELEGNSGGYGATIIFPILLSAASAVDVTVQYTLTSGTAVEGRDYRGTTGTITIPAGYTRHSLNVSMFGDLAYEADETLTLTLSAPTNAVLGNAATTGTILNDDVRPVISLTKDAAVNEGDSGPAGMTFTVTLTGTTEVAASVEYVAVDLSAVHGSDYLFTPGTLTFEPGETTKSIVAAAIGDTIVESDETFEVRLLDPVAARLGTATALATVIDDDRLTIAPATIGSGSGMVSCTTDSGASCDDGIKLGTSVTLTARASDGSSFSGWSGGCTGTGPVCTVTVTKVDFQVSAEFTREFTLTIRTAGGGGGTASHWNGVAYSTAVIKPYGPFVPSWSGTFAARSVVPLKAEPDTYSVVRGWSGDCTSSTAECTVTMDGDKTVTVAFTPIWTLTMLSSGSGIGSLSVSPTADPSLCGTSLSCYLDGTTVTITATASSGSAFDGWSGDCSGTTPTCTLVMNSDKGVSASFDRRYGVTIIATTDGIVSTIGGTVRLESGSGLRTGGSLFSPGSVTDCPLPDACTGSSGSSFTLRAVPAFGHVFTGWSGACTGTSATCTLSVSEADVSVSARFAREYKLTVYGRGAGGGTVFYWNGVAYSTAFVRPAGSGSDDIWAYGYVAGTSATIRADAGSGSSFMGWSGDCSGRTECTLTMDGDKTVYAQFSETYLFGGFRSPVESGRTYRLGSTLPIKFQLRDAQGALVTSATARISAYRVNGAVPDTQPAETDLIPDDGDTFRFTDDHYQYNLRTKGFGEPGMYVLFVDLDDGSSYRTSVYLK